jgi:hypothetical protein
VFEAIFFLLDFREIKFTHSVLFETNIFFDYVSDFFSQIVRCFALVLAQNHIERIVWYFAKYDFYSINVLLVQQKISHYLIRIFQKLNALRRLMDNPIQSVDLFLIVLQDL